MCLPPLSLQLPCQNSEVKAKSCTGGVGRDPLKAANTRGAGNPSSPRLSRAAFGTLHVGIGSTRAPSSSGPSVLSWAPARLERVALS